VTREELIALAKDIECDSVRRNPDLFALAHEFLAVVESERVGEQIIADYSRVLDALPCPLHGQCVPFALEEIARLKRLDKKPRANRVS
jgi:hypothetical protein